MRTIIIVDYDPRWPEIFEQLRSQIWPIVREVAVTVEHVGSTSVAGLAAKPIVDISVVVPAEADVPPAIKHLSTLGYVHRGDLGVDGREAFTTPSVSPLHHLYLCPSDSLALANHLAVRNYLRAHPDVAHKYGALKKQLANEFPNDVERYTDGKTDAILRILHAAGFRRDELEAIKRINRRAV